MNYNGINPTSIDVDDIQRSIESLKFAKIIDDEAKMNYYYRSQMSAFGASALISGILPSISFFSSKSNNNSDEDRTKVLLAIAKYLSLQGEINTEITESSYYDSLCEYAYSEGNGSIAGKKILEAATIIKYSMLLLERKGGTQ